MKKNCVLKMFRKNSLVLSLLLAAVMSFGLALPAPGQVVPSTITSATNLPAILPTLTITNIVVGNGSYVATRNGSGLGVSWKCNAASGSSNAVVAFCATADGTNYSTTPWDTLTNVVNGTTDVIGVKSWSAAQLQGIRGLGVLSITNGNNGVLTNKGVTWNRPN
jgi:hypothetical protein